MTQSYPTYGGDQSHKYETEFVQDEYYYQCDGINEEWENQAVSYAGGATTASMSAIPGAGYCVPETAGAKVQIFKSQSSTLTVGFSIPAIGFGGSSQTGYTSSAEDDFAFSQTHHLCGTSGYIGDSPGQVVEAS